MSEPSSGAKRAGPLAALTAFTKPFWVINSVELFERGAYYGMLAVLSTFLLADLGAPATIRGILLAVQFPLLYFLPVVAGALSYKYGFKKLLYVTFAALTAGYLVLSVAQSLPVAFLGIVLFGVGAGLFKPMPAATVTETTTEADRNFGFAIYYWMINLGAFLLPLGMQMAFGGSYRSYFAISAALSVLNLVLILTTWKDVRPPDPTLRVGESVKKMGEIFHHPAFVVLLLIYSGFWFMYTITTSFLQNYAVDYGILTEDNVALIVPANALAILLLGPILSKATGRMPSLPLMIAGIAIFCSGFLLIGFVPTLLALLAGVFIYSLGEFLTHPSYLSYVSKISPPERVAMFLGCGFISVGIGQTVGSVVGGVLYGVFVEDMGRPQLFWVAVVAVGLVTVAALLVYNTVIARRALPRDAPAPAGAPRRGTFLTGPAAAVLAVLLIPALVVAGTLVPAGTAPEEGTDLSTANLELMDVPLPPIEGNTACGATENHEIVLPENATGLMLFVLQWQDEPSQAPRQNEPDTFVLHVRAPGADEGNMTMSGPVKEGRIEVQVDAVPGMWSAEVELQECGPNKISGMPVSLPNNLGDERDPGNAWSLTATYQVPREA